jgi:hypothetical protein
MSRDVAILGCGPAGLLTALAVEQAGFHPVIYSIPVKSKMPGAQFLHAPIPDLTTAVPEFYINFAKFGNKEGYAQKVYGRPDAPTSWDSFPAGPHGAWSLARAYDRLWDRYSPEVVEGAVTQRLLDGIEARYRAAFSTIPAPILCNDLRHEFHSTEVWIRTQGVEPRRNYIEYNGDPKAAYYRSSRIGEYLSFEFGHRVPGAEPGLKPLDTDCDCRPHFHRVGRFGRWTKGVLVHHAYFAAQEVIRAVL